MRSFVVVLNNGKGYGDYVAWNVGVFETYEQAYKFALTDNYSDYGFDIEEWNESSLIKTHEIQSLAYRKTLGDSK